MLRVRRGSREEESKREDDRNDISNFVRKRHAHLSMKNGTPHSELYFANWLLAVLTMVTSIDSRDNNGRSKLNVKSVLEFYVYLNRAIDRSRGKIFHFFNAVKTIIEYFKTFPTRSAILLRLSHKTLYIAVSVIA